MGGSVGLKGTDGPKILQEAVDRGAKPVSPHRAKEFLEVAGKAQKVSLVIAEGPMGGEVARKLGLEYSPVGQIGPTTSRDDTVRVARAMLAMGIDLLAFVGGDGTARDVLEAVGDQVPTIGVPAGVKVYSSVFAVSPRAAGYTALQFLSGEFSTMKGEVLDIDEEQYRLGHLAVKLNGYLLTIGAGHLLQNPKVPSAMAEGEEMEAISDYMAEEIVVPDRVYILGPGTTVENLAHRIGVKKKTVLGVDVVRGDGTVLALDASEKQILQFMEEGKTRVIISPIGGQGFLLGRGNQQVSPRVLSLVGADNLIVLATKTKMASLHPRRLIVDTGDPEMDERLRGYRRVIVGYREEMIVKVE